MSEGELYRNPIQELEQLKRDLNEIKGLMKDVALRMSQIERHVKRAFVPIGARDRGNDTPERGRGVRRGASEHKPGTGTEHI